VLSAEKATMNHQTMIILIFGVAISVAKENAVLEELSSMRLSHRAEGLHSGGGSPGKGGKGEIQNQNKHGSGEFRSKAAAAMSSVRSKVADGMSSARSKFADGVSSVPSLEKELSKAEAVLKSVRSKVKDGVSSVPSLEKDLSKAEAGVSSVRSKIEAGVSSVRDPPHRKHHHAEETTKKNEMGGENSEEGKGGLVRRTKKSEETKSEADSEAKSDARPASEATSEAKSEATSNTGFGIDGNNLWIVGALVVFGVGVAVACFCCRECMSHTDTRRTSSSKRDPRTSRTTEPRTPGTTDETPTAPVGTSQRDARGSATQKEVSDRIYEGARPKASSPAPGVPTNSSPTAQKKTVSFPDSPTTSQSDGAKVKQQQQPLPPPPSPPLQQQPDLKGYVLFTFDVKDVYNFKTQYQAKVDPSLVSHEGRFVVRNPVGSAKYTEGSKYTIVSIVEFPSIAKALAWHDSAEYQAIVPVRNQYGVTKTLMIFEGPSQHSDAEQGTNKGYLFGEFEEKNRLFHSEYILKLDATLQPFGGCFLVRNTVDQVAYKGWRGYDMTVLIEFPSVAKALEWKDSSAHKAIRPAKERYAETVSFAIYEYPPAPPASSRGQDARLGQRSGKTGRNNQDSRLGR
jgi:uncharacterized protein (DUF1330 family)